LGKDRLLGDPTHQATASGGGVLTYIEGFARVGEKSKKSFYTISYASLKESKYLLHFSLVEKYLEVDDYNKALELADKIGAMLWGIIKNDKE